MAAKSLKVRAIAFQPTAAGLVVRPKMHPLDDAVGFQEKQPALAGRGHDRAVVSRTGDDVGTVFSRAVSCEISRSSPSSPQRIRPLADSRSFIAGADWEKRAR